MLIFTARYTWHGGAPACFHTRSSLEVADGATPGRLSWDDYTCAESAHHAASPWGLFLPDQLSGISFGNISSPKRLCAEREASIGQTPHTATTSASGAHTCIYASRRPMHEQAGGHILRGGEWVEHSEALHDVNCETMCKHVA